MENVIPQSVDVARILGLGTIGLGFLLALLAFRLLQKEQAKDRPRDGLLRATNRFMLFSGVLCLMGLTIEIVRIIRPAVELPVAQSVGYWALEPSEQKECIASAEQFLGLIAGKRVKDAYAMFDGRVKTRISLSDFEHQCDLVWQAFGANQGRRFDSGLKGITPFPDGPIMVYHVNFIAAFEKTSLAAVTVTSVKDGNGVFSPIGFNVR